MPAKETSPAPVVIGGIGGSGTRVIAKIIQKLGYRLGPDLNVSLDNLWFTLLFKHREALVLDREQFSHLYDVFRSAMTPGQNPVAIDPDVVDRLLIADRAGQHDRGWLLKRLESLSISNPSTESARWGWKEPNTHMFIDRIFAIQSDLRYIHVIRNGLDMAHSANQNQLRIWGPLVLVEKFEDSPRGSLRFWRWAHERIIKIARFRSSNCLLINMDALCRSPEEGIEKVLKYCGVDPWGSLLRRLAENVRIPDTIARHKLHPEAEFDKEDVEFVESLGFSV